MYMQPAGMGAEYQAVVDVLYVMQVWAAPAAIACNLQCASSHAGLVCTLLQSFIVNGLFRPT